ncbi:P2X purinoceptor 7-like [Clytia hemisphaerica]|uniref:P2X purinoceptor 7-like n=1 Tax=Clytia hemisphaerica TaxID=252671 RepID=UPI0034D59F11
MENQKLFDNVFLTQELEYPSSFSSPCTSSDNECSLPDLNSLKPYDFEPEIPSVSEEEEIDQPSENKSKSRIGNTDWCECGECRPMDTETESLCCLDTNEVPEEYFEGKKCVSKSDQFHMVCIAKPVLKTALSALNNLRGDEMKKNPGHKYAGYKQYTWWVHNHLGFGVRKVIPSCSVLAIRITYPAPDAKYIPFMEYKEEEKRLLEEDDTSRRR